MAKITKKNPKKALVAAMVGNMLESYDFTLYGFFIPVIAPLFFPSNDPLTSMLSGFGVFAVGFLARPLGALLFGHLGDTLGRKVALMFSILSMAIPTFCIGLLPTYAQIGMMAPILLTLLRVLQGLAIGGEYNGSGIFVVEHSERKNVGFFGGMLTSSGMVGALLGTLIGAVFTLNCMPIWAWRIPFLLGIVVGGIGFYLRKQAQESLDLTQKPAKIPFLHVIKNYPLEMLTCISIGGLGIAPFYMVLGYINPMFKAQGILSTPEVMLVNSIALFTCAATLPFMGKLADKVGLSSILRLSALSIAFLSFPLLFICQSTHTLWQIIIVQSVMIFANATMLSPSNAFMSSLFPAHIRYSGVAIGYSLGMAILGGTTPLISAKLVQWTGNPLVPALYLITCSLFVFFMVKNHDKKTDFLRKSIVGF